MHLREREMSWGKYINLTIEDLEKLLGGHNVIFGETEVKINPIEDWNKLASIIHIAYRF